jgi:hypothetical protein
MAWKDSTDADGKRLGDIFLVIFFGYFPWLCGVANQFLLENVLFGIRFELVLRHFGRNNEKEIFA